MSLDADHRAYESLRSLPRAEDIGKATLAAIDGLLGGLSFEETSRRALVRAEDAGLAPADANTPLGNAIEMLRRKPEIAGERSLARAMAAHALGGRPWSGADGGARAATEWLWLATHTPFNALGLVDHVFDPAHAAELWTAIAERVRAADASAGGGEAPSEALVAAAALLASPSEAAGDLVRRLTDDVREPTVAFVLATAASTAVTAEGEIVPRPRGTMATVLLGLSGLAVVMHSLRLLGRWVLGYRTPAEIVVRSDSVQVRSRTELLGRTLREQEVTLRRGDILRATREVRYPSLALYAGLSALGVGSFFGVVTLVDGVRVGSPSLVVIGAGVVAAGLLLDFLLSCVLPTRAGRCRVVLVPRRGGAIAVGRLEISAADALLTRLRAT
jgi:hypothetical protein